MSILIVAFLAFFAGMHTQAQTAMLTPQEASVQTAQVPQAPQLQPTQPDIEPAHKVNSLRVQTLMRFPAKLKTLRDTTLYLLEPVNYKLVESPKNSFILARPLLSSANNGSLKPIEEALLELAGDDIILVVDHDNKLVTFEQKMTSKP